MEKVVSVAMSISLLTVFILVAFVFGLAASTDTNDTFEQVGYYKGANKLRYFTVYVKGHEDVDRENIPAELEAEIVVHGSKQMHTDYRLTATFYYTEPGQAPNVTGMTAAQANAWAHDQKPLMAVWIMANEQVNVFRNPQ